MFRSIGLLLVSWAMWGQFGEPKVRVDARGDRAVAVLDVENSDKQELPVKVHLAWLDEADHVVGVGGKTHILKPGKNRIEEELPLEEASSWLRLKLEMSSLAGRGYSTLHRTYAFTEISEIPFALRASAVKPEPGAKTFFVRAIALNPKLQRGNEGVQWDVEGVSDGEKLKVISQRVLDGGFREFEFGWKGEEEAEVTVRATRGPFREEVELLVRPTKRSEVMLQTDKSVYQPGQRMHIRAVGINSEGKAAKGEALQLEVQDPDGKTILREELKASIFGVVHRDWVIPELAETGLYAVYVNWNGDRYAGQSVRVSRYELPTFSIEAKAKRTVLMPGEDIEISVAAKYFSKQPVPGGMVRIYEGLDDDPLLEAKANPEGSFVARLNGPDLDHKRPYQDFVYRVSYIDPGTLRKEETRIGVRVTREKLHVYFHCPQLEVDSGGSPFGYVVVSYADGRPAEASVEVQGIDSVRQVKTNRFGVARVNLAEFGRNWHGAKLTARTADGSMGTKVADFLHRPSILQLIPKRRLYQVGEALELELVGKSGVLSDAVAVVEMHGGRGRVRRTEARLRNGVARLQIPYGKEMSGLVQIAAWVAQSDSKAFTAVFYPTGAELQVVATPGKAVYRPGEEATLAFRVQDSLGNAARAALGVSIVDEAVEQLEECRGCETDHEAAIAGLRLRDLSAQISKGRWNAELDLVAEVLLSQTRLDGMVAMVQSQEAPISWKSVEEHIKGLENALKVHRASGLRIPTNEEELSERLRYGYSFGRDPWDRIYRPEFGLEGPARTIALRSSGPDGRFDTPDDVVSGALHLRYFEPYSEIFEKTLEGLGSYPLKAAELVEALRKDGFLFEALKDPWGKPYYLRLQPSGKDQNILVMSAGPDRVANSFDDFVVERFRGSYFSKEAKRVEEAMNRSGAQPKTKDEFLALLRDEKVPLGEWIDPWGNVYAVHSVPMQQFTNRYEYVTRQTYGAEAENRLEVLPTKQSLVRHLIVSAGEDGKINTPDDAVVWQRLVYLDGEPEKALAGLATSNGGATISGVIFDRSGAVIPGVKVTLTSWEKNSVRMLTDGNGFFQIDGLAAGRFGLEAEMAGFQKYKLEEIPLIRGKRLNLELVMEVGSLGETVSVEAVVPMLQTSTASLASQAAAPPETALATPRLREYFPETLLWNPELVTDSGGRATLKFPMADSITTWKAKVMASTEDGRWAEISADLRAFQPFFLDLETPRILTEGDEVELPFAVRDYQQSGEKNGAKSELRFERNDWGEISNVGVNSLSLRARKSSRRASLQATVRAGAASDAVRKSLEVRPDGKPVQESRNALFLGNTEFVLRAPADVLRGGRRTELRVYTHMDGILSDAIQGLVRIPTGCGEQTTSSAYLNLAAYRFFDASGGASSDLKSRVLSNLQHGVDALEQFRTEDGGMAYWKDRPADTALSAYALQFLAEASSLVRVSPERLQQLVDFVAKQEGQNTTGAALSLRGLVAAKRAGAKVNPQVIAERSNAMDGSEDAYGLAVALAANVSEGRLTEAARLAAQLRGLAKHASTEAFWESSKETPFHGWGTTAIIETTGLATQAFFHWIEKGKASDADRELARAASFFLIRSRGVNGIWHSTQATLRAVEGIVASRDSLGWNAPGGEVSVLVNGKLARRVPVRVQKNTAVDAVVVDLSEVAIGSEDKIEVRSSAGGALLMASLEAEYFVPWTEKTQSPFVILDYDCGTTVLRRGESASCTVLAHRVGGVGRGMLIAEIGLAPGMQVDRGELEKMRYRKFSSYEVHPEKLIFYLEPSAGNIEFSFGLRARFKMEAKARPSRIYDYNNPEAAMVLAPVKWVVRD